MSISPEIEIGQASESGPRARNEDFHGAVLPEGPLCRLGALACVADGIGGCSDGRQASEMTVRSILNDYYATPMSWQGLKALHKVVDCANGWLFSEGRKHDRGLGTTLVAALFRGRTLSAITAGDTRLYRLRSGRLKLLSRDHVFGGKEMSMLTKAVGMDDRFTPDVIEEPLQKGDRYLLLTDGVWAMHADSKLFTLAEKAPNPQKLAEELVRQALANGGADNATAVVVDVKELPSASVEDTLREWVDMPVINPPKPDQRLDGFKIFRKIHNSQQGVVLLAKDEEAERDVVLKFPDPLAAMDTAWLEQFAREEWAGLRVQHPNVVDVLKQPPGRRHAAYHVQEYLEGNSLRDLMDELGGRKLPLDKVVDWLCQAAKGLLALHRKGIVHRDVKPDNLFLARDRRVVLLDLGTVHIEGLTPIAESTLGRRVVGGTPGFMAPELHQGELGDPLTDLFALGVTGYLLLTGKFPYGQPESNIRPDFEKPAPVRSHRPEIPFGLAEAIERCISVNRKDRPGDAGEFIAWLDNPALLGAPEFVPLINRNPLRFYQWGFWIFLAATLALLAMRL